MIDPHSFPYLEFDLGSILEDKVIRVDRYIPVNLPQRHVVDSDILFQMIEGDIGYKTILSSPSYLLDYRESTLVPLVHHSDRERSKAVKYI